MRCRQLIRGLTLLGLAISPGLANAGGDPPGQTPPTNTAAPTISGAAQLGSSLTANVGSWDGKGLKFAYQWQNCDASGGSCSSLGGATAATYTPVAPDATRTLRVVIIASNNNGSTVATSSPTGVVTVPVPQQSSTTTTTASSTTATTTATTATAATTATTATTPTSTTTPTSSTTTTTPQPTGSPYYRSDFSNADFCPSWDSVMESTTVNPLGYYDPCLNSVFSPLDTSRRVFLTQAAGHPGGTSSPWASHQEIRTTDAGWADPSLDKATLSMTSQHTFNGPFSMGTTRWFRFSFLLPNNGPGETFNWPTNSWNLLANLHVSIDGNGDAQDMKVQPWSGNPRYITTVLEGASSTDASQWDFVNMLQLTDASGNRIASAFNTWHTVIWGITFSNQGTIGNSPGHMTIIFDGQTLYDKARPTARTGETGPWFQLQNYKSHTESGSGFVNGAWSSTVYYADVRIGSTQADVGA